MKGAQAVVDLLNDVLTAELTAINQYLFDAKMCESWGYAKLAAHFRADSIDEMGDAEKLIERILYLEGVPNLQRLGAVKVGEAVPEKLSLALALERDAIRRLNDGIVVCTEAGDNGSRELLQSILAGEEEHADWLETQLGLIERIGEALYLTQQVRE